MIDNNRNREIDRALMSVIAIMGKSDYFSCEIPIRITRPDIQPAVVLTGHQKGRGGKRGSADWKINPRDRIYG